MERQDLKEFVDCLEGKVIDRVLERPRRDWPSLLEKVNDIIDQIVKSDLDLTKKLRMVAGVLDGEIKITTTPIPFFLGAVEKVVIKPEKIEATVEGWSEEPLIVHPKDALMVVLWNVLSQELDKGGSVEIEITLF
jgi:hypothetical protein